MIQDTYNNDDDLLKNQVTQYYQQSNILNLKNCVQEKLSNHNSLPQSVSAKINLENVLILNLSHNHLKQLPDNLSALKNLESLDLSNNKLIDLPYSYGKLKRLQELNISGNNFKSIPKCVAHGMGTLKVLNVSQNPKIKMNIIPYSKYLEKFDGSDNNECDKFPEWILSSKFFNIRDFNLNRTKFNVFSFVGLNRKIYLNSISMTCSNLSSSVLNMMLENVVHIKKINFGNENLVDSGNVFNTIPIDILKNPALITEVNFRGTNLPFVPTSINQLCNLTKLDLGCNKISWFPEEICQLQKLETLKIDDNNFLFLPKNIGSLKSLKELRAEKNGISSLPESFINLKNLQLCDFYDNLLKEAPTKIFELDNLQGLDIELNFFWTEDMLQKDAYLSLRRAFISFIEKNGESPHRSSGAKMEAAAIDSDDSEKVYGYSNDCSITSESDNDQCELDNYESKNNEENWEAASDPDDNFEPESPEITYCVEKSRKFIQPQSVGFCPADLHSSRVKHEVAYMRAHGSLQSCKIEEGQFDDA